MKFPGRSSITMPVLLASVLLTACSPTNDNQQKAETGTAQLNPAFPYSFDLVTDNVWVIHGPLELPTPQNRGFMNNPGLVKTSAGLVVVDPGSSREVGDWVLSEIKKISDQPVVAVFNTHVHGDHWLGNQAIKQAFPDVKIYGHAEMITAIDNGEGDNWVSMMENLTEGATAGTTVTAPDHAVNHGDEISIGDTTFRIHHFGIAHTKTDIMIEAVEPSLIFLGDNVLSMRLPRTSDGTFQGTIGTINKILEVNAKHYVPGHGPSSDHAMVEEYKRYLELVYAAAKQAFDEDLDSSDVISITRETTADYSKWSGYDPLLGPHGAQAYAEVELAEF